MSAIEHEAVYRDHNLHSINLQLIATDGNEESFVSVFIEVPDAISPFARDMSQDRRVLGIALRKIELDS